LLKFCQVVTNCCPAIGLDLVSCDRVKSPFFRESKYMGKCWTNGRLWQI